MSKKCNNCEEMKPLEQFHLKLGKRQSNCKICATKIAKEWYKNNKHKEEVRDRLHGYHITKSATLRKAVAALRGDLGCAFCDECDSCCLEFHHVQDKDKCVSDLIQTKNVKKVVEEINKCACVCSNCHRKIHAKRIKCGKQHLVHITEEEFASYSHVTEQRESNEQYKT